MTAVRTAPGTALRRPTLRGRPAAAGRPAPSLRRAPAETRRPDLRVARPVGVVLTRRVALVAVFVVALVAAVLAVTASQALVVQSQDRFDELQQQIAEQRQLAERQALDLARLQAPERIVGAATDRLGMVAPSEIMHLRNDPADDQAIAGSPSQPSSDGGTVGADG